MTSLPHPFIPAKEELHLAAVRRPSSVVRRPWSAVRGPPREATMPIMTEDMKRVVREQKVGFIATVCPDGTPNLSSKGRTNV